MKKIAIFFFVLATIFIVFLSFITSSGSNYIKIPEYTHSHTMAFCNLENLCQDYEIFCENERIISLAPITGAIVQFSEKWEDPRSEEQKKLC